MKINEIIRKKRIEKGYTQEQLASFLGVSAPAVNKWEKAASYPDITLLPALARLLGTDLNTLLSFQEDLTKDEIGQFLDKLVSSAGTEGMDSAFHTALEKIHEYPSCDALLLNTALTLEGLMLMHMGRHKDTPSPYMDTVEELYTRVSDSSDPEVGNLAKAMLISKLIEKKEFEAAEKLLAQLPNAASFAASFSRKQLKATLYMKQEEWGKAARLMEQKVLSDITSVQSSLYTLIELAIKEDLISDARQLADIARQVTGLFGLWECSAHIVDFQLAAAQKDVDGCIAALEKMLPDLQKEWKPEHSPLYRHLPLRETDIGQMLRRGIQNELDDPENHAYDFLRDIPKVQKLLEKYR